jgi:hypothetical protein
MKTLTSVAKTTGIIVAALVTGGAIGFACDKVGVSTTSAVAIIAAGIGAVAYGNKNKRKLEIIK